MHTNNMGITTCAGGRKWNCENWCNMYPHTPIRINAKKFWNSRRNQVVVRTRVFSKNAILTRE